QKILIIEDEKLIRKILIINLEASGYQVLEAETGKEGIDISVKENPDCIILDLGLPDIDGLKVLSSLREWFSSPIIILSVRKSDKEIINALDNGANDYVTKPFRTGEVLARIRVSLRNNITKTEAIYINGDLTIDLSARTVKKGENILKLTTTEYSILWLLIQNENRVITHKYLLEKIWGDKQIDQTQYLRVYIGQLRKKIEDSEHQYIITESGIGYRFINNEK
ncbi:MAG: response regulator transcription factor, partial [Candidatus Sericytochromatia bacterium]|nr:response regulator transcription factor [Candidatus Sericytochromatia bacterium]